ncbi:MAG: MopE-related protein [bacterium]
MWGDPSGTSARAPGASAAGGRPASTRDPPDEGPPADRGLPPADEGVVDAAPADRGVDAGVVDAAVDAAIRCTEGDVQPCGSDEGVCEAGTQVCQADGSWGHAQGPSSRRPRTATASTTTATGGSTRRPTRPAVRTSARACRGRGAASMGCSRRSAEGGVGPTPEGCNALDDDCDGRVDEEVLQACDPAEGRLRGRHGPAPGRECATSRWRRWRSARDGGDNDCDGAVDEAERPCG